MLFSKNKLLKFQTFSVIFTWILGTILHFTYTGIIGTNFAVLDIGSFFIGVILGEFVAYKIVERNGKCNKGIAMLILIVLLFYFIVFTYNPPNIGLFIDPEQGLHYNKL